MTAVDIDAKIPNNVGLADDRRLPTADEWLQTAEEAHAAGDLRKAHTLYGKALDAAGYDKRRQRNQIHQKHDPTPAQLGARVDKGHAGIQNVSQQRRDSPA